MPVTVADTLAVDSTRLHDIFDGVAHNYDNELMGDESRSLLDMFFDWFSDWIKDLLNSVEPSDPGNSLFWWCVGFVLLGLVVWLIARSKLRLFWRKGKDKEDYTIEDDNIYAFDFDREIADALAGGNYRHACRMVYLQTLRRLSDAQQVEWRPYKTPTQYTAECSRESFVAMTQQFLRVRYGNRPASRDTYDQMVQWQADTLTLIDNAPAGEEGEPS